jgi:6-phosphogluconolactonase
MSGNCAILPLAADGSLKPISCMQQHTGSGVHPVRQTGPHPHAIVLDPSGRFVLVPDLGLDQVKVYRFDPAAGTLTPNDPPYAATKPGGGPRHCTFHPNEPYVYVNLELTSDVTAFRYDAGKGVLTEVQTISTLPDEYDGMNANAGICITPDGRFLYVSNRGHNSIAQFAVDRDTGTLTSLGYESTRGDVPQTIGMEPEGRYIVATDRRAGHARLFRINRDTGILNYTGSTINIPNVGNAVFLLLE